MKASLLCGRVNSILASFGLLSAIATCASANTEPVDYNLASPTLTISDVTKSEGNSGRTEFEFKVRLSPSSSQTVKVDYTTVDGSATTANNDYLPKSGTLTFAPGKTSKTIEVKVVGDRTLESDEQFFVQLSNAVNATIADPSGTGTIKNDDAAATTPNMTINDVSKYEGKSGTTAFTFKISLSQRTSTPVTVQFSTADGTALASDNDYFPVSGTLTVPANEKSANLTIFVKGDRKRESDETFFVNLSSAVGANITDPQGKGTIRNDDSRRVNDDDSAELASEELEFARPTVFPNPARGDATLAFSTTRSGPVRVELHDVAGRLVRTLADESNMPAGVHRFTIGRESGGGARLSPGIYFYRVQSPDKVTTGRLVVLE